VTSNMCPICARALITAELRAELLCEVKARLEQFERSRCGEDRGRLLQALENLALLVRSSS